MVITNVICDEYQYYKYQVTPWTQPVLSDNGIIGYTSFAVTGGNKSDGISEYYYPFQADRTELGAGYTCENVSNANFWYLIYSPVPINITKWMFYYTSAVKNTDGRDCPIAGNILAGNSLDNYTSICDWSLPWSTAQDKADGWRTINLSSNTGYYKYYKITVSATNTRQSDGNKDDPMFGLMEITATQKTIVPGTAQDYDIKKNVYKVLSIPENVQDYGIRNVYKAVLK